MARGMWLIYAQNRERPPQTKYYEHVAVLPEHLAVLPGTVTSKSEQHVCLVTRTEAPNQ